jgi:hypothetical protein
MVIGGARGSGYYNSCQNCNYDEKTDTLKCQCKKGSQLQGYSSVSPAKGKVLQNSNGHLIDQAHNGLGDFYQSCQNCVYKKGPPLDTLTCQCPKKGVLQKASSLQIKKDDFFVYNNNGQLGVLCSLAVVGGLEPAVRYLLEGNTKCAQKLLQKESSQLTSGKFNKNAVKAYLQKNPGAGTKVVEFFIKTPFIHMTDRFGTGALYNFNFLSLIEFIVNSGAAFSDFIIKNFDNNSLFHDGAYHLGGGSRWLAENYIMDYKGASPKGKGIGNFIGDYLENAGAIFTRQLHQVIKLWQFNM